MFGMFVMVALAIVIVGSLATVMWDRKGRTDKHSAGEEGPSHVFRRGREGGATSRGGTASVRGGSSGRQSTCRQAGHLGRCSRLAFPCTEGLGPNPDPSGQNFRAARE